MQLSQEKTKSMIINFITKNKFTTRLELKESNIQIVNKMKILGTVITDTLSWDENCHEITTRLNKRMRLLKKTLSFGATKEEMVHLWIIYCRSILEQSAVLWTSSLTQENKNDLEQMQKCFVKLIYPNRYKSQSDQSYRDLLLELNLQTLEQRREILSLKFAKDGIKFNKLKDLFPENTNEHSMKTRHQEKYKVLHANTNRLKNSSILYMQNLLNNEYKE